jgi:hypothetical protein
MKLLPSCKDITEHSSDYLDKHMSLWGRARFRVHLFMCVHCQQYIDQLKLTIATLGSLGESREDSAAEVDENQVQDIIAHIRQSVGQSQGK